MKLYISILYILLLSTSVFASPQDSTANKHSKNNIFLGVYLNDLNLWSQTKIIELSPFAGYRISPRIEVGIGTKFRLYRNPLYSIYSWGANGFTRYTVIKKLHLTLPVSIFVHAEYEYIYNINKKNESTTERLHYWTGLGLSQMIGSKSFLNILVLWNLHQYEQAPINPSFRLGFIFPFF